MIESDSIRQGLPVTLGSAYRRDVSLDHLVRDGCVTDVIETDDPVNGRQLMVTVQDDICSSTMTHEQFVARYDIDMRR